MAGRRRRSDAPAVRAPSRPRSPAAGGTTPSVGRSPFHRLIGLELYRFAASEVELRLPWREEFRRADGSDWYHGGVIAALVDIAGDYAVAARVGHWVPTIDLRVDYLRPALEGTLAARARAVKVGRSVAVADIELSDARGSVVAIGRAAYATGGPARPGESG